jgi:xanthine/CO dehydrogenase XdhC/CoxF family maturation factor
VPGIHGKDPAIIAASVTAQLLQTLEQNDTTAPEPPVPQGGRRLTLVGRE